MDRRQFFKYGLFGVAASVGALTKPMVVKAADRAVLYGRAAIDMDGRGGYNIWLATHTWSGSLHQGCGVCVKCVGVLKKGQRILWFPDGSVMGVNDVD